MKTIRKLTKYAVAIALAFSAVIALPAFSQETTKLSDPEVAHVAVTANQIDINAGEQAKQKSKNPDVIKFAETMINDHKAVIEQASALVKKLGVTPMDNAVSKQLLSDAEKTKQSLKSKKGKDFDKAYIDNEVAYHKAVISAVETLLIPETENHELKELLQNILPALQAHLHHAEMLQKQLSNFMKYKGSILMPFFFSLLIVSIIRCSPSSEKSQPKVYEVEIKGMKFQPAEIIVKKGDTVIWINKDFLTHDVTEEKEKSWTSSPIPSGKSWKIEVKESVNYFCSIHPVMKGKIVVE